MNRLVVVFILSFVTLSCKNEVKNITSEKRMYTEIEQLNWLVGNWSNISEDSESYENWNRKNDSTLTAFSYVLVSHDTVFSETVLLQQRNDSLYFTVSVPNQNEEKPVTFIRIPSEERLFIFENKQHDFPKRIIYTNPVKDSIHAWIEGTVNGEAKKADFYYSRLK